MKALLYIGNKTTLHGLTPGVIDTLGPLLEKSGIKVYYAGYRKSAFLRLVEMLWSTVIKAGNVDYILIDTYSTKAFWYAYLTGQVARFKQTKYIPILHGGDLPKRLSRSKIACDRLFNKSYANIAVSGYLFNEFEKRGYKTIVIPNSIDITKYQFKSSEQCKPQLLWVRSFHRQYNPNMAADVLDNLLNSYPDTELCMIGPDKDGSMEEFKNYVKEKGIENHVRITGKLAKEEWIRLSKNYDFFINTTNVDNTPISVIEAMALGLCVISTDPGGIPFLLNDGIDSFLVKPGDSSAMADKINYLVNNPQISMSMTQKARQKAQRFDWEQVRPKWVELLK